MDAPLNFRRVNYGNGHGYTVNGRKVPGVTTLLSKGVPKPALVDWAGRTVGEYVADHIAEDWARWQAMGRDSLVGMLKGVPAGDRDAAANKGTKVHNLARAITDGEEVEVPDELTGHVDAYLGFLSTWHPTDELTERPVLNVTHNYAGSFDLMCTLPGLGRCLIDTKTSRSGIFPETALQLCAYRRAEWMQQPDGTLVAMPEVDHALALWVRADGWDLYPVNTDVEVFRTFLYAADIANNFAAAPREVYVQPALPTPEVAA